MDELWTSAKHIAQSDGKKDDWVYVVDVYKSMGGTSVALMIHTDGEKQEIIGEAGLEEVLVCDSMGQLNIMEKSTYTKSKKKFVKRDVTQSKPIEKSMTKDGIKYSTTIYEGAKML